MKRAYLLKRLKGMAGAEGLPFELLRDGGNHTIYVIKDKVLPVPRHSEINERTAKGIIRQAEIVIAESRQKPEVDESPEETP